MKLFSVPFVKDNMFYTIKILVSTTDLFYPCGEVGSYLCEVRSSFVQGFMSHQHKYGYNVTVIQNTGIIVLYYEKAIYK